MTYYPDGNYQVVNPTYTPPASKCPMRVAYICDGEACVECNNPECHHTEDIRHAKNFECIGENLYMEKEKKP